LSSPATLLLPIFKLQLQTLAINPCYLPTLLTLSSLAGLPLSSSLAPPCLAELSQLCRKTFLLLFSSPEWLVQVHTLQAFKSFALTFPDGNVTTFMPPDMRQRFVAHLKAIPISSTPSHVDPDQICKEHHIQMARPSNRNHTHGQPHDHSATQEAHSVPLAERRRLLLQAAQACGELLLEFQGLSQRVPVQELKKDNSQEAQRFRESVDGLKQAIGTLPIFHS
ncbi:MAG: hypothetical protein Q8P67_24505, partial [archaeon]|nr:hypothetical protein [archaeon]